MYSYKSLHAEQVRSVQDEAVVRLLERLMPAVVNPKGLDETLSIMLEACVEELGYLYPSVALLYMRGDKLVGQVFSSPSTWDALRRTARLTQLPIDNILGRCSERRSASRVASGNADSTAPIGRPPCHAISYSLALPDHPVVRTFLERRPHVTARFQDIARPYLEAEATAAIERALGIRSMALLPLCVEEKCLGLFIAARPAAQPFSAQDLSTLQVLSAQVTMAIESTRLRDNLRDREQQVHLLLKTTIDAQEEERERICLDIHDGVAQTLASAFHCLQTLDSRTDLPIDSHTLVRKAAKLVRESIREARGVVMTLRPPALDVAGLVPTLRFELDEIASQTGWLISFDADEVRYPKPIETALYRIVHEAVTNVKKHARARTVTVRIKHIEGHVVAEVRDDGVGFDSFAAERQLHRRTVGLLSMRKRTELLQGSFDLVSSPGTGTRVAIDVPLLAF
ncbi:MAG: GAF domain-containing sensor histidine kinase [Chloroflexota bacterium]|nr:MAG: GAF domain-containing sensor histidine kinase [Chloroflexota bacterium]